MIASLISAFLMYSRIPMPQIAWQPENRRFALGWFPAVGAVIGILLLLWRFICDALRLNPLLFAGGAVILPILITGGIHADGFCDVTDARASYAEREKRLQIMADPHIGSFAVMQICLYLILQTALFTHISTLRQTLFVSFGYILSRAGSALSAVTFKNAKQEGTLQSFVNPSHKTVTLCMVTIWGCIAVSGMMVSELRSAICAIIVAVCVWLHYKSVAYREFGGTTGDLCGWFLQRCELGILAASVLSNAIWERFV